MSPLRILIVDDERIIHQTIGDYLSSAGHQVDGAVRAAAAFRLLDSQEYDVVLLDVRMPEMDGLDALRRIQEGWPTLPVVLISGHGSIETVVEALRAGASDFLVKPVGLTELDASIERARNVNRLLREQVRLRGVIGRLQQDGEELVGESPAIADVRHRIAQIAEANADSVLITGETGTGKELVARAVHRACAREGDPLIVVSCPSVPETLFESEFFGHVRGAFTGAGHERPGYFELANGGTLFLDEIADIPVSAQAALLRVLETRRFRRIGGARELEVSVRVIAATNAPLEQQVERGRFRRDLLYRINQFSVHIPPLRERRDDVLPLARHFLRAVAAGRRLPRTGFSPQAKADLMSHDYPGNVRELRNLVERAALVAQSPLVGVADLAIAGPGAPPAAEALPTAGGEQDERERILAALEQCRWNRKRAAAALDLPYSTLRYKMKIHGIE